MGGRLHSNEEDKSENARFPYRYMVGTYCVPDSGDDGGNVGTDLEGENNGN